jgi:hypothetical protein
MGLTAYVGGIAVLAAVVLPLWLAAGRLRARLLPAWTGPPARLAEAIVFLAMLFGLVDVLGAAGRFRRFPMIAAAVVIGGAVWLRTGAARSLGRQAEGEPTGRGTRRTRVRVGPLTIAVVVTLALVTTPWLVRTLIALRTGIWGFDSMNYHLPFAARFFQEGRITALHFVAPGSEVAFDPANSETLHAIGMVAFRRDILSPVLNLAWLALALWAAWCVGRPRRVSAATMGAVVVLLATNVFMFYDSGQATNDIADIALLLAAVALILHSEGSRPAIGLAAVAAGMGLANKLTMVAPVAALTLGVILAARRDRRRETALTWLLWLTVTGSFWYLRNLFAVGNPVPGLHLGVGPVALASPYIRSAHQDAYSVAHYLGDTHIWRTAFVPGLRDGFGWDWPLILILAGLGCFLALLRGDRHLRMLGCVAIASGLAYLVTPQGAAGPKGHPVLFTVNLRFAFPALALGLVLVPLALPRGGVGRQRWLLLVLIAATAGSQLNYANTMGPSKLLAAAIGAELLALALVGAVFVARSMGAGRCLLAAGLTPVLVIAVAVGFAVQHSYMARRYTDAIHAAAFPRAQKIELGGLYDWVRHVSHARIGVAGIASQYPLFAPDLTNYVQYVGHRGPHGAFDTAQSCREWRRLLTRGRYDYVVTGGHIAPQPLEPGWTKDDPAVTRVLQVGTATVFRVHGPFDAEACPR